jgi:BirA family biotin operon repressor/biotin-[acetyl-CoA-carboxylase] ligase
MVEFHNIMKMAEIHYHIIHLQELNSTNTYLKELAKERTIEEGTVIMADFQSGGKGRGNNVWVSEAGLNLTVSIFLRPMLKAVQHFMLNEIASLAVIDMLRQYGIRAEIKWPNDIYVGNRKIAGILIENVLAADKIETSVIGIGLNVNQLAFPEFLPNPVSMAQILDEQVTLKTAGDSLLQYVNKRYSMLTKGNLDLLHHTFTEHLYKKGSRIEYKVADSLHEGILHDVAPNGELIIKQDNGSFAQFQYAEVQLQV